MATTLVHEATTEDVPSGRHVLAILDKSGDTRIEWDPNNEDEVANAQRTFQEMKKRGFVAYAVRRRDQRGEVVREFDPSAEKLILAMPHVGG